MTSSARCSSCAPPGKTHGASAARNLINDILRHRRRDGSFDGFVSYTSFAIFALRRSGVSRNSVTVRTAGRWLERRQNSDGGFNVGGRGASGIDDTGYAAQALAAAGLPWYRAAPRRLVPGPRAELQRRLPAQPRRRPQRAVDSLAIQGLVAAGGHDPAVRRGQSYLRSLTEPNGLVRYSRTSRQTPVWVSAQALLALNRRTS